MATIVEPEAPAAPPAPTTSISVTPQTVDTGKPVTPPKPGSARDRLYQKVVDKAAPKTEAPKVEPEKPKVEVPKAEVKAEKPAEAAAPKEEPAVKEKVSPWKLVDQYKAKAAELEKQLADAKTSALPEPERKAIAERLEKAEARAKALEDEIRFVAYEKSAEFQKQYQEPYQKAWTEAVYELGQIPVVDPVSGAKRYATADDLSALMGMSLEKAREVADANFGVFANDVMAYRKDVLKLFNARAAALEEARKTGAERELKLAEETNKTLTDRAASVKQAWEKANQEALTHEQYGKYFTPVEGDQQINDRLAKGYKLVDRAFTENPLDPKLSSEERAAVIKRHAAVRNRAAAFGRLVYQNQQLEAKLAELSKELEGFKNSEPETTGSQPQSAEPKYVSARDRLMANVQKLAK